MLNSLNYNKIVDDDCKCNVASLLDLYANKLQSKESKIRSHFDHIRYEIDINAESLIDMINKYRDELLENLKTHESNEIKKIEDNMYNHFLKRYNDIKKNSNQTEIESFKDSITESMQQVNNKFEDLIKFQSSIVNIKPEIIGKFILPVSTIETNIDFMRSKFEETGVRRIDYGNYYNDQHLINDCLVKLLNSSNKIVLISYVYNNDSKARFSRRCFNNVDNYKIRINLFNDENILIKFVDFNEFHKIISMNATNDYVYLCFYKCNFIKIYDMNLVHIKNVNFGYFPSRIFITNSGFYVLSSEHQPFMHVFNNEAAIVSSEPQINHEINSFGQNTNYKKPYYLNYDCDNDININESLIFTFKNAILSIISISNGVLIKQFSLLTSVFYFQIMPSLHKKLIFSNLFNNEFEIYDYDGNLVTKYSNFKFKKFNNFHDFYFNDNYHLLVHDKYNKILYTN